MQFLEPRFNRRTDHYGGSFANRSRFFVELLHALKRALGACGITTRFEIDTLHGPEGVEAREDGVRMLELLRHEGVVDAVALKIGDYAEWGEDAGVSRFRKSGWMTPFIKQGKSILGSGIPVVGNGRLTSPDDMVALIRAGALDIIGAARPSHRGSVSADQDLGGASRIFANASAAHLRLGSSRAARSCAPKT